jgi:hypothetical protein
VRNSTDLDLAAFIDRSIRTPGFRWVLFSLLDEYHEYGCVPGNTCQCMLLLHLVALTGHDFSSTYAAVAASVSNGLGATDTAWIPSKSTKTNTVMTAN